uniref:Protein kinase domain-containing protein n=1 Tax=Macrostomum lignano TaxID=282301 RepID=A0A1I8FC93_9PLAT
MKKPEQQTDPLQFMLPFSGRVWTCMLLAWLLHQPAHASGSDLAPRASIDEDGCDNLVVLHPCCSFSSYTANLAALFSHPPAGSATSTAWKRWPARAKVKFRLSPLAGGAMYNFFKYYRERDCELTQIGGIFNPSKLRVSQYRRADSLLSHVALSKDVLTSRRAERGLILKLHKGSSSSRNLSDAWIKRFNLTGGAAVQRDGTPGRRLIRGVFVSMLVGLGVAVLLLLHRADVAQRYLGDENSNFPAGSRSESFADLCIEQLAARLPSGRQNRQVAASEELVRRCPPPRPMVIACQLPQPSKSPKREPSIGGSRTDSGKWYGRDFHGSGFAGHPTVKLASRCPLMPPWRASGSMGQICLAAKTSSVDNGDEKLASEVAAITAGVHGRWAVAEVVDGANRLSQSSASSGSLRIASSSKQPAATEQPPPSRKKSLFRCPSIADREMFGDLPDGVSEAARREVMLAAGHDCRARICGQPPLRPTPPTEVAEGSRHRRRPPPAQQGFNFKAATKHHVTLWFKMHFYALRKRAAACGLWRKWHSLPLLAGGVPRRHHSVEFLEVHQPVLVEVRLRDHVGRLTFGQLDAQIAQHVPQFQRTDKSGLGPDYHLVSDISSGVGDGPDGLELRIRHLLAQAAHHPAEILRGDATVTF